MRPTSSEALSQGGGGRSRKSSSADTTTLGLSGTSSSIASGDEHVGMGSSTGSMTYFLADEATVAAAVAGGSSSSGSARGMYGVRSLESSLEDSPALDRASASAFAPSSSSSSFSRSSLPTVENPKTRPGHTTSDDGENDQNEDEEDDLESHVSFQSYAQTESPSSRSPHRIMSEPLTPLMGPSPEPPSTPRRRSLIGDLYEDLHNETAVEDGSPRPRRKFFGKAPEGDMLTPQLIMPEITIPSRRPFTEKGKRIGRLKVLIAGDSGIGKTSLIKSIVQTCEDIVHVDPLTPNTTPTARNNSGSPPYYNINSRNGGESTKKITEIYASTRSYPQWWSELDDSKILRRRKSKAGVEEQVIERNICFVDTPGYGFGTSFLECVEPVVRYVEGQLERTHSLLGGGEGDVLSLLSGSGTQQVDVVFYVILHRIKPVDIEFIRRLSPYTSVLPVIAKADTLTSQQLGCLKLSILDDLRNAGVRPFLFGKTYTDVAHGSSDGKACAPFAISSIVASDADNMDASILMSPDYVQPLMETELKDMVEHIFHPENIAWLKHAAAKKYIQWRSNSLVSSSVSTNRFGSLSSPAPSMSRLSPSRGSPSPSALLPSSNSSLIHLSPSSFALARVTDHTQREERMAQVRLSRWAHDLQRSLQAERERYECLAKGERAIWLTERLGECVRDGQLIPSSMAAMTLSKQGGNPRANTSEHSDYEANSRDPLGILAMNEIMQKRAVLLLKLAGYGGMVGVVGVWMFRNWGVAMPEWLQAHQKTAVV